VMGDPINASDPTGLTVQHLCWLAIPLTFSPDLDGDYDSHDIVVTGRRSSREECRDVDTGGSSGLPYGPGTGAGLGGGQRGGGDTVGTGTPQNNQEQKCVYKNASGQCVYDRDKNGKLQLDPDYAQKACEDYHKMMTSNKEVGAAAGATNLPGFANVVTGGKYTLLGRLGAFFSQAGFVFIRGVTYLTTAAIGFGSTPPPGCH